MTENEDAAGQRRRVGQELRRLREAAGKRVDEVAEFLECSQAKISRIETGRAPVRARDVRDMLQLYGIAGAARESLLAEARQSAQKSWWGGHHGAVPKDESVYIGLEAAATKATEYGCHTVPWLLQTAAYTRALLESTLDTTPELERRLEVLARRQLRLTAETNPLRLHAIVDDSLLGRAYRADYLAGQFDHLIALARLPHVTIQVVGRRGFYPGFGSQFSMLTFGDSDLVQVSHLRTAMLFEHHKDIAEYHRILAALLTTAMDPDETVAYLRELRGR